jgi:PAS domain S-box-containing protein
MFRVRTYYVSGFDVGSTIAAWGLKRSLWHSTSPPTNASMLMDLLDGYDSDTSTSALRSPSQDSTVLMEDVDDGSPICDHEHTVQFYDTQDYLMKVLINFVTPILRGKDAAVVIATETHLAAFEVCLRERRVSVEDKKASGQLVMLDANKLLDELMSYDGGRSFSMDVISSLLRELNLKFAKTYVYGEIVNLLCALGNHAAAIRLEEMWNLIIKDYNITLLCGYDMSNFKEERLGAALKDVCCTHSRIGPAEDYPFPETPPSDTNERGKLSFSCSSLSSDTDNVIDTMIAMLKQKARALETEIERRKSTESTLQHYLELLSTRAEESLRHQQESYRTLLSFLPVGVFSAPLSAYDGDGVFVNQRFCELSGLTETEIRINGWATAVHVDDRGLVRPLWDTSSHHPFGGKEEYRFVLSDGSVRWVAGQTVPFTSHEGKAQNYIHTVVDITELKDVEKQREKASRKAEELLRNRAEQAERHKRDQDQFIDTLCHELRNPLSSIHGNVELLQLGLQSRQTLLTSDHLGIREVLCLREQAREDQESIHAIEKCVAHQKVITDDVLNLSKLEVGKVVLRSVEFNPKSAVMEVMKMFEVEANRKGVALRFNFPVSDIMIKADPDRVSQVLINLIANALKFTTQGCITLGLEFLERKEGRLLIRVTVKDTGIGLTKQEREKLFHRFMQPTSTSYDESGGSGLGLVISKGLVELMGGTISVESAKGQGSQFAFTFMSEEVIPLSPPVRQWTSASAPAAAPPPQERTDRWIRQILIVEDNAINQRFLTRLLEAAGFVCSTASNGVDALTLFERRSFDLILMDVHMPVMDGITSTREIRALEQRTDRRPILIVGLSGNAREEHRLEALNSGMDYYLTKPCKKEELYSVIDGFDRS